MSQHAVVHFEIAGPDTKALQSFYGKLFGWTINADNPMNYPIVFKMDGGIGGGLPQPPGGERYVTFYVNVGQEMEAVLKKAESMGAKRMFGPDAPEGGPIIGMFADPDGNQIGLVGGEPPETPPPTGGGAPVAWFEIAGSDAKKTQDFYRELFGWTINADNEMGYGEVAHVEDGIGGGVYGGMGFTGTTIYAVVDDLTKALAKANELGGKTVMEPSQPPGGPKLAQFSDPAGNQIGLLLAGSYGNI